MNEDSFFNMAVVSKRASGGVVRRAFITRDAEGGGETASATITTADVDREGDTIDPSGIDTSAYERNPVVLWAHDVKQPPIARAESLSRVGNGIRATWRWATTEAAQTVRRLWDEKILNAVSIGFLRRRSTPNGHGGLHHSEIELLEFSIVPVPANPAAVRAVKALGLGRGPSIEKRLDAAMLRAAEELTRHTLVALVDELAGPAGKRHPALLERAHRAARDAARDLARLT